MKSQPSAFRTQERSQTPHRTWLYHFDHAGTHYYFAAYDRDLTVTGGPVAKMADPQLFPAAQISHTNPEESMEAAPRAVSVSVAAPDQELRKYLVSVPPKQIGVDIWRVNSAALGSGSSLAYATALWQVFRGIVTAVGFDDVIVTAECVTQLLQEDRLIPRFNYQKLCNHMLYGPQCGLNKALFSVSLSIAALNRISTYIDVSSTTVNVDSPSRTLTIAPDTFEGGVVEDSLGNKMGIYACEVLPASAGTRLWLAWMPRSLAVAQTVTLSLGCIHIKRVCHETFFNLPNFGGTPFVPVSSPAIDGINA